MKIKFWNILKSVESLIQNSATEERTWTFPNKDGTVAMIGDLEDYLNLITLFGSYIRQANAFGTDTYTATISISPTTVHSNGALVLFVFENTSTGAASVTTNGTTKKIFLDLTTQANADDLQAGIPYLFIYKGSLDTDAGGWLMLSGGSASVPDADASTKGIAKLNDTGSLGSATDAAPTQRAAKEYADTKSIKYEHFAASDETTGLTTGTGKVSFRMPYAGTLVAVRASIVAAQTSGSILTININKNGSTVLSTKLTIDNNAKTSVGATTPAVISVSSFADDDEVTVDIDQVGNGTAAGLKIKMFFS